MSVVMSVFLQGSKMLAPPEWAKAIRSSGFDMGMDHDFDPTTQSGFLPCQYAGEDAGFEYYWEAVSTAEIEAHVAAKIGNRDIMVSFVTHSDMRGLMTSIIASSVLCANTDGVLWDTEADECIGAAEALDWGKAGEAGIKNEL